MLPSEKYNSVTRLVKLIFLLHMYIKGGFIMKENEAMKKFPDQLFDV